jgi:hypothetical protein
VANRAALAAAAAPAVVKESLTFAPIVLQPAPVAAPLARIIPAMSPAEPATLSLGTICGRLGFTVSGDFLRDTLHIAPARTDKRAAGRRTEAPGEAAGRPDRRHPWH